MRKFLIGFCLCSTLAAYAQPAPPTQAAPPDSAGVYDKLWVQTSADYRAHCLQTYGWATRTLREIADLRPEKDAQGRLVERINFPKGPVERPRAVVMDLDDTVIDMSAYRAFLTRIHRDFEIDTWNLLLAYLAEHPEACRAVPGALDFIHQAEEMGYTVFFLSNRTEEYRSQTVQVLKTLGLNQDGLEGRLWLDPGHGEDARLARAFLRELGQSETSATGQAMLHAQGRKERRRFQVSLQYQPMIFVGDDLGDFLNFVKEPQATPQQVLEARYAEVARQRQRFGREFFILPNPMYGSWSPGASLPAQKAQDLLHDDGFVEYYRSHSK